MTIPMPSLCEVCKHLLSRGPAWQCGAFPLGIPREIFKDLTFDHRKPWSTETVVFEQSEDADAEFADAILSVYDKLFGDGP